LACAFLARKKTASKIKIEMVAPNIAEVTVDFVLVPALAPATCTSSGVGGGEAGIAVAYIVIGAPANRMSALM
jgi:hypothetical protein